MGPATPLVPTTKSFLAIFSLCIVQVVEMLRTGISQGPPLG